MVEVISVKSYPLVLEEQANSVLSDLKNFFYSHFKSRTGSSSSREEFEELFQDICLETWQSLFNYRESLPLRPWVKVIGKRKIGSYNFRKETWSHRGALANSEAIEYSAVYSDFDEAKRLTVFQSLDIVSTLVSPSRLHDFMLIWQEFDGNYRKAAVNEDVPVFRYKTTFDQVGFLLLTIFQALNDNTGELSRVIPGRPERYAVIARAVLETQSTSAEELGRVLGYRPGIVSKHLETVKLALATAQNILKKNQV
ncbi:MAG: sigma factor [Micrococcaceae bacterium]